MSVRTPTYVVSSNEGSQDAAQDMRHPEIPILGGPHETSFFTHEQAGRRPALVLSETSYNAKSGLAIVCPVTSEVKGYPFEVPIAEKTKMTGVILSDQIKSIHWKIRKAEYVCAAPRGIVETVRRYLSLILNL